MMRNKLFGLVMVLATVVGAGTNAQASTLLVAPGDVLEVNFTSNPVATPCPGTCDVLALFLVLTVPQPIASSIASADLYGGSLLGSTQNSPALGVEFFFHSAGSAFGLGNVVDFSTLQNNPFSGTFYVTTTQAFTLDTVASNVDLGHGTGSALFAFNSPTATITSIFVVPEPAYGMLTGGILALFAIERHLRRKNHEAYFPRHEKDEADSTS